MRTIKIVNYRGKWCALVRDENGERKRLSLGNLDATATHRAAAERAFADLTRDLARAVVPTCDAIFHAYLADKANSERPLVSEQRARDAWKALRWHFAPLEPKEITREVCRAYIRFRRDEGKHDGTIRTELSKLRTALLWHDKHTPAVFELPPPPQPKDRWLTRDEFRRLLAAAEGTFHLTVFLHLAIATAGRKEALLEMTWDQVRFDRGEVFLGWKKHGKKRATVPLTDTLRAVLSQAKGVALTERVIEFAGAPVKSIRTAFEHAVIRAGFIKEGTERKPELGPHTLRHTAAVWMVSSGVPLEAVSDYLGHSDINVTKRVYAKFAPEHLRHAAKALEID